MFPEEEEIEMAAGTKAFLRKQTIESVYTLGEQWKVVYGKLKRGRGRPPLKQPLFLVVGEKLPFEALYEVRSHLEGKSHSQQGVYVAHDSMGCPRYIGRGSIFVRLEARRKANPLELKYFSFYVVAEKQHEREIETLLIRTASFLLEFNSKKKRVGTEHGYVGDFEAGTLFYERQQKKGRRAYQLGPADDPEWMA